MPIPACWRGLRTAWNALPADAVAEGRYASPLLVRWAVRLDDGSYLWMSDPLRVGDETLGNADRVSAMVTTSGGAFTGIEASTHAHESTTAWAWA